MRFFDTHAHLDALTGQDSPRKEEILADAWNSGVRAILVPGVSPVNWPVVVRSAAPNARGDSAPQLYCTLGIHPMELPNLAKNDVYSAIEQLSEHFQQSVPGLIGIGECGLDRRGCAQSADRIFQASVFREQLLVARRIGCPTVVHCVQAFGQLLEILAEIRPPPVIVHGYTGSAEIALELCRRGHAIGLGGILTHPSARKAKEAARKLPLEHIVLETDAPDQTPFGRRPLANEPAFLLDNAQALADIRGQSLAEIAEATFLNAVKILQIDAREPEIAG